MRGVAGVAFLAVALMGCGGGDTAAPGLPDAQPDVAEPDTSPDAAEGPGPLTYNPCPRDQHIGGFEVTRADEYTGVNGQVYDGVVPGNIPDVVKESGDCALLQAKSLFCDPGCVPGETCGTEGTCIPYPVAHSVGEVTIAGLKSPLSMEAKWGNHYTNPGTMEHPGYEEGSEISLYAQGGDYEAFALRGYGVSALDVPGGKTVITGDGDVALSWTPPAEPGPAQVHIELNLNNHGWTSAWIACDAEDTGTFVIPGTLVTDLYEIGVSGFPSLNLTRRSADSATIEPGCVQLTVAAHQTIAIEVDGVTSCTHDGQCPPGASCGADLQCH